MTVVSLGFDASTTGAGAVLLDAGDAILAAWCWQAPKGTEGKDEVDYRIFMAAEWAERVIAEASSNPVFHERFDDALSCAIEAPFFRGSSSAALAEVQGAIKSRAFVEWGKYTNAEVKATAHAVTGIVTSGKNAGKQPMIDAALSYRPILGAFVPTYANQRAQLKALGDVCDAFWVAKTDQLAAIRTERESA